MSAITEIAMPDGEVILARVTPAPDALSQPDPIPPRDDSPFDEPDVHDVRFDERAARFAADELSRITRSVVSTVRQAVDEHHADEVSIDFGVEFSVKSGRVLGVLAEVGSTSSIVVHLTWRGPSSP